MASVRKTLLSLNAAIFIVAAAFSVPTVGPAYAASEIKYVVNNVPVTNYDIQRRAAFLKLQRKKGNLTKLAADDMIDQTLKQGEMRRLNIRMADTEVDAAYARFAKSNKMTPAQLNGVLDKAGVTAQHFKDYIRTQLGWNRVLSARFRAQGGTMSEQDAVRRMLQDGGNKPSATEYVLQQVIFVVPASERGSMGKRKKEAEAMRQRFTSCESTREFAKGLIDVTVRDLGRVLAPELPGDWAEQIKATKIGGATPVRETDRGVEFIGICRTREVSDDRVAKSVFQAEGSEDDQAGELDKKYMTELRERAKITER
ncbi:SurA N-terminal domain-containing protein [Mesorhizobium sp. LHD-90]|uniref:peptidylprolyl isomerase n=1 Tax=Mesorhizobium sp. LHD-90 TaxID=3071414 RepID=UPI0027E21205|nr:SurA N-terminal domain-containing protein [Mesorhizobium sp. LHD-90]MDQ6435087.1 SurA N-terminal domain-containing protein [Mesorhizobium sp. LHD-90]